MMKSLVGCILLALQLPPTLGNFLAQPRLRWSHSLDNRSIKKGNAVVADKTGNKLFVTSEDGSLHLLSMKGGVDTEPTSTVFEPEPIAGTVTECRSGVGVKIDADGEEYLVYVVVDTPVAATDVLSSRVLAVNMDASLRWEVSVDGAVQGNALLGDTGIYLSHNVDNVGHLSVIRTGANDTATVTADLTVPARNAPFGPPALHSKTVDPSLEPFDVPGDIVVVGESWDEGYREAGHLYMLRQSPSFEELGGDGEESYEMEFVSYFFSSVTAPLMSGTSMWAGGAQSSVVGWSGNRDIRWLLEGFDGPVEPRWSIRVQSDTLTGDGGPIVVAPVASNDDSLIFVSVGLELYAIQNNDGQSAWSDIGESAVLSQPIFFEDDGVNMLYSIESLDGTIRQHSVNLGERLWEFNCPTANSTGSCQDSVEAEFSLAPTGNVLYYGDVLGNIKALEVAAFGTVAPTDVPSSDPSLAPTVNPTATMSPSTEQEVDATSAPIPSTDETPDEASSEQSGSSDNENGSVFDELVEGSEEGNSGGIDKRTLGLIVGISVTGILACCLLALMCVKGAKSRRTVKGGGRRTPKDEGAGRAMIIVSEVDEESAVETQDADDTVTVSSDSIEVEVVAGSTVYGTSTPKARGRSGWKRRTKQAATPPTPATLASIDEEHMGDEESVAQPTEVQERVSSASRQLEDSFNEAAEEHTSARNRESKDHAETNLRSVSNTPTRSLAGARSFDSVSTAEATNSSVMRRQNDTQLVLPADPSQSHDTPDSMAARSAVRPTRSPTPRSPTNLPPSASFESNCRVSQIPLNDATLPVVPLQSNIDAPDALTALRLPDAPTVSFDNSQVATCSQMSGARSEETDDDVSEMISIAETQESVETELNDMSAAQEDLLEEEKKEDDDDDDEFGVDMSPRSKSPSTVFSNDDSLYTDTTGFTPTPPVAKLSPLSPHIFSARERDDIPEDELMGKRGGLLMPDPTLGKQPEWQPYNGQTSQRLRPSPDEPSFLPAKYGQSVRKQQREAPFPKKQDYYTVDGVAKTNAHKVPSDMLEEKKPGFKRRSKREEPSEEDTWSTFLQDLAEAEDEFFAPTGQPKATPSILSYDDSDDASSK